MSETTITHLTGPESPDTLTSTPPATPRAWYRRPLTWGIAGLVAAATAVALILGLMATSPHGAAGRVAADGYHVTLTLDHGQLKQMVAASGDTSSDTKVALTYVDSLAYGTKGTKAEAVMQLTPAGAKLLDNPLFSGMLAGSANTAKTGITAQVDGSQLVMTGPASQLNLTGGSNPLGTFGG
jgi:hypothetical protein